MVECVDSVFIGLYEDASGAQDCLDECRADPNCEFFTYYEEDEDCVGFLFCDDVDECYGCYTGSRDCDGKFCDYAY